MPKVIFETDQGTRTEIEVPAGWSIMEAARQAGVVGIIADCGGNSICGTCHVIVRDAWLPLTGPMRLDEEELLDMVPERALGSRLSCQIAITSELDGVEVGVPRRQIEF